MKISQEHFDQAQILRENLPDSANPLDSSVDFNMFKQSVKGKITLRSRQKIETALQTKERQACKLSKTKYSGAENYNTFTLRISENLENISLDDMSVLIWGVCADMGMINNLRITLKDVEKEIERAYEAFCTSDSKAWINLIKSCEAVLYLGNPTVRKLLIAFDNGTLEVEEEELDVEEEDEGPLVGQIG